MKKIEKYLCFDVGGTNVKYSVLSSNGDFLERGEYATKCFDLNGFVDDMIQVINDYDNKYQILGVGISFPGFINPRTGYAEMAGAIEALNGKNLKELLNQKMTLRIEIENDANCAALAEKLNGNATECNDFICMTIGTGIGGGIFVNGQIVHGHRFKGGEFGFMIINGTENGYQNMHDLASTQGLISAYRHYKGTSDEEPIEGNDVFREAGNEDVKKIIDTWYTRVSHGILNLASVLNPEKILIGGAISVRDDLYVELHNKLSEIPVWPDIAVKIEPCKHRNDAGMLGALYKLVH